MFNTSVRSLYCIGLLTLLLGGRLIADEVSIVPVERETSVSTAPLKIGGRVQPVERKASTDFTFQWPGVYFECAFDGPEIFFDIGKGEAIYHILVDGSLQPPLSKPKPGRYAVSGLSKGKHVIRVEAVTESQAAPNTFGGFFAPAGSHVEATPRAARSIEFIGDSHTVGYGVMSSSRVCSPEEIWAKTNTSQTFAVLVAKHYSADYQVNAYSGRGIVRNYNGFASFTLPEIYPYTLFDQKEKWQSAEWHPQVIVIDLGTNDFSTALHSTEKWRTRDELHGDYEKSYVQFVQTLRHKNPNAYFVLAGNEMADGEIQTEVRKVVDALKTAGESRLAYVLFKDLTYAACNSHPSVQDDEKMAGALITSIDQAVGAGW